MLSSTLHKRAHVYAYVHKHTVQGVKNSGKWFEVFGPLLFKKLLDSL